MGKSELFKDVSRHFAFGQNWASYATMIDESRIKSAQEGLVRLLGEGTLAGKSLLDIGCGSGIHALAALRLGVTRLLATDIDKDSVATTTATLTGHAPHSGWECREISVFELDPAQAGTFDVVYSWGVLHHTGAMYEAITRAAALVAPGGILCIGLYGKTPLCGFWKVEKRIYAGCPPLIQRMLRKVFFVLKRWSMERHGLDYDAHIANYAEQRGMDFEHDVHDWMGGFSYESISRDKTHAFFARRGFTLVRESVTNYGFGWLGTGCDEYVFQRAATSG